MCVSSEESGDPTVLGTAGVSGTGSIPEIVVTAPRIALSQDVIASVDWAEVATLSGIAGLGGLHQGGIGGALVGAATGAAAGIETQEGVDLTDLFEIRNDMPVIPGLPGPFVPLF